MPWRGRNSIELSSQELRTRLPANAAPDAAGVDGRLRAELQGRGPGLGDRSGGLSDQRRIAAQRAVHRSRVEGVCDMAWCRVKVPTLSAKCEVVQATRRTMLVLVLALVLVLVLALLGAGDSMAHGPWEQNGKIGSVLAWAARRPESRMLARNVDFFWRRCNLLADLSPANLRCTVPLLPR